MPNENPPTDNHQKRKPEVPSDELSNDQDQKQPRINNEEQASVSSSSSQDSSETSPSETSLLSDEEELRQIASAAAEGQPQASNTLIDKIKDLPSEQLLPLLQVAGKSPYGSLSVLWLIAYTSARHQSPVLNAISDQLGELTGEQLLPLLQVTATKGLFEGMSVLWLMAYAGNRHQQLLKAIIDKIMALPDDPLVSLLQATAKTGPSEGKNVLWLIAWRDSGIDEDEDPRDVVAMTKRLAELPNEKLLPLLEATAKTGDDEGKNVLWRIANAGDYGYRALNYLSEKIACIEDTEQWYQLMQASAKIGYDENTSVFWLIAMKAVQGNPRVLDSQIDRIANLPKDKLLPLLQTRPTNISHTEEGVSALWLLITRASKQHVLGKSVASNVKLVNSILYLSIEELTPLLYEDKDPKFCSMDTITENLTDENKMFSPWELLFAHKVFQKVFQPSFSIVYDDILPLLDYIVNTLLKIKPSDGIIQPLDDESQQTSISPDIQWPILSTHLFKALQAKRGLCCGLWDYLHQFMIDPLDRLALLNCFMTTIENYNRVFSAHDPKDPNKGKDQFHKHRRLLMHENNKLRLIYVHECIANITMSPHEEKEKWLRPAFEKLQQAILFPKLDRTPSSFTEDINGAVLALIRIVDDFRTVDDSKLEHPRRIILRNMISRIGFYTLDDLKLDLDNWLKSIEPEPPISKITAFFKPERKGKRHHTCLTEEVEAGEAQESNAQI